MGKPSGIKFLNTILPTMQISQEQIEVIIANANKPRSNSNFQYPLNELDDRLFEILTYSIFKKRIESNDINLIKAYDEIHLMQGVGEKGMDCILMKERDIKGVIQCKKYASNISDTQLLSELIKFSLHVAIDSVSISSNFIYSFATSKGYTGKAILLPTLLKNGSFVKEYDISKITSNVLKKYKEFNGVSFNDIEQSLIKNIRRFNYELIRPEDYALWINDYPSIIETFFEIKKVTDNSLLEEKSREIIEVVKELFPQGEAINISSFLESYKKVAKEKLNVVNFIGFDIQKHRQKPTDITLTDLYIQPSFVQRNIDKNEKVASAVNKELRIANLFKSERNLVILGHPGAGKSLLVKFLIVQLLENKSETIGIKQFANYLPLRIELRKYNEVVEQKGIIAHLVDVLAREYHTSISISQLERIFDNSCTLIFFDGLDEIFNISHKTKIKDSIEAFGNRFPLSKCVVTSRFIGYHDIKFNPKYFDEFAILNLDDNKIKELVTKFYASQYSSIEKRKGYIDSCLRQLNEDVDDELKSNPLILTLILILASNNIVIPESKLEIYESCTKTLVDSIDLKEKELKIEIPVKNKSLVFAHLAYFQYELMSKNFEVTYDKATKIVAELLLSKKECMEYNDAEGIAMKFLEYAERRSIYFENNFTHKTFLEYFTAEYLYSNCIAKASDNGRRKLIETVSKYLPNSFWYIVFELLFTRIDKVQPDNELLDEVFSKQLESNSLNVFYFLVSNLRKFNNVSANIKRQTIKRTILLCIKGEKLKEEFRRGPLFWENSLMFKIAILEKDQELAGLLQEAFDELERDGLSDKQRIELYNIYFEVEWSRRRIETRYGKIPSNGKLRYRDLATAESLALKDLLLFSNVFISRNISGKLPVRILVDQIENFGIKTLFNHIPLRYSESVTHIPTFDYYLLSVLESSDYIGFKSDLDTLSNHGLQHRRIIEHAKGTRIMYFIRSQKLERILNLYLKSDDHRVDEILLGFIKNDKELKLAYDKFKTENSHPKLKNVDKLFDQK